MSLNDQQAADEQRRINELLKVKSVRKTARANATSIRNQLGTLLSDDDTPVDTIEDLLILLQQKEDILNKVDADIISYSVAGTELEKDTNDAMKYQEEIALSKKRAERFINKKNPGSSQSTVISNAGGSSNTVTIIKDNNELKLPAMQLPKFSGDITEWAGFWSQFEAAVGGKENLNQVRKCNYLFSCIEGEAKESIAGMKASPENYAEAVSILKDKYDRKDLVIHAHSKKLMRVKAVRDSNDVTGLRKMYDTMQINIRCLKALDVDATVSGNFICPVLIECLPPEIRLDYSRAHNKDGDWNLTALVEFLRKEVEGRETCSLLSEAKYRENREKYPNHASKQPAKFDRRAPTQYSASASALTTTVTPKFEFCIFCSDRSHPSVNCRKFSLEEKRKIVTDQNRCYICLRKNHQSKDCRAYFKSCKKCHGNHNYTLCNQNSAHSAATKPKESSAEEVNVFATPVEYSKTILLQTAKIYAKNPENPSSILPIRCLLDSGSQASFIKEEVSRRLKLPIIGEQQVQIGEFGNQFPKDSYRRKVRVILQNNHDPNQRIEIVALEVPYVCRAVTMVNSKEIEEFTKKRGIRLADEASSTSASSTDIGLLVGGDYYWDITTAKIERFGHKLVALETMFGWAIQGPVEHHASGPQTNLITVMKISATEAEVNRTLKSFWDLESLGINQEEDENPLGHEVMEKFKKQVQFKDGRYQVNLPWATSKEILPNNLSVATKRMKSLVRRFKQDPVLYQDYRKIIEDQLAIGIAEELPVEDDSKEGTYYLPHQPVRRETSQTTKLRVVFDASSSTRGAPSLNACLASGPNLNPDLLLLILKFRFHHVAVTSDIEKAFLQVALAPEDKASVRFLWVKEINGVIQEDKFKTLCMARVPFGITSSPFLLAATIKNHVRGYFEKEPEAAKALSEELYVDDFLSGGKNVNEALKLSNSASSILKDAGMNLRKWLSNSAELNEKLGEKASQQNSIVKFSEVPGAQNQKVLGLLWNPRQDSFTFDLSNLIGVLQNVKKTKRYVLSTVSQIFDPVGILAPYTIRAKFIFQQLWIEKVTWDQELPEDLGNEFQQWCNELKELRHIAIPRCYFQHKAEDILNIQLHCFCDASSKAYAAVVYVRYQTVNQEVIINLITSKARVAPLNQERKCLTLPRLELMGCLLGAKLIQKATKVFEAENPELYLWTDSTIAVHWIRRTDKVHTPFVQNRAKEIREMTNINSWSHCPGITNPADVPTRGMTAEDLQRSQLWWQGAPWLKENQEDWPEDITKRESPPKEADDELRKTVLAVALIERPGLNKLIDLQRYSTINKALRITAYLLRFLENSRRKRPDRKQVDIKEIEPINADELIKAEIRWVKCVQQQDYAEEIETLKKNSKIKSSSKIVRLKPILDQEGLICLGGRLEEASLTYEEKHPVLLNNRHHFTELIMTRNHEEVMHGGVTITMTQARERYFINSARQLARRVINKCLICRRQSAKPGEVETAPLPRQRIDQSEPFEIVGIDFAGPLLIKNGTQSQKTYICLYTCAVTRAIHLELVPTLTSYDFLLSFRRMISRRAIPHVIYSDNALTFHRANRDLKALWESLNSEEVKNFFGQKGITWKIIIERAAWHGGWWERLVKSTKIALRKVLGRAALSYHELETILLETEAMINSRPITYYPADPNEPLPLTPSQFLVGKRLTTLPPLKTKTEELPKTQEDLRTRIKHRESILNRLWNKWKTEYLMELRSAQYINPAKHEISVKVDDVVLVHEDKIPRHMWKMGRITETILGRDGKIRACLLKTTNGNSIRRPIQLVYPMDID